MAASRTPGAWGLRGREETESIGLIVFAREAETAAYAFGVVRLTAANIDFHLAAVLHPVAHRGSQGEILRREFKFHCRGFSAFQMYAPEAFESASGNRAVAVLRMLQI